MRFCKDCKWHTPIIHLASPGNAVSSNTSPAFSAESLCLSEQLEAKEPIWGESHIPCAVARNNIQLCGIEARWFAPKEQPNDGTD